ncbi:hypothetical protein OIU79_005803 [Salix purpurea]|uniref:Uncharacterized protein n=1 Tax=Salix purpurea TaxID=77065 RepID=A0A9Q0Z1A3_SALPP|nr:hypothetical protein OIU79_005803 [Salix purpurea]
MKKSRSSRHFFGLPLSFLIPAGLSLRVEISKDSATKRCPCACSVTSTTPSTVSVYRYVYSSSQMEPPVFSFDNLPVRNPDGNDADTEGFKHSVDGIFQKVDKLERRVNEVEQFYLNISKKQKQQQDASKREAAAAKRMQELMRQLGTTLRQIAQHKWAWPFMQPVDVKGLGEVITSFSISYFISMYFCVIRDHKHASVIDKPMDLSTIKNQMEANDGTGYKNVREICADARLVFKNAMKYNDEKSDVHVMARTLLGKFEEKWLQLLPKVTEEEKRREDEEVEAKLDMQLAQEAAMARDLSNELYEVDMHLAELRNIVVQKCRKMSSEEKRKLGVALTRLSPEDLTKALEIVAQNNPGFQATAEEVDLDIDAQAESTLWRLKFFVKDVLEVQGKVQQAQVATTTRTPAITTNKKERFAMLLPKLPRKGVKNPLLDLFVPYTSVFWILLKAEEWSVNQKVKYIDLQLQCQRRRFSISSL